MKSESEIREMWIELLAARAALAQHSTAIVLKPRTERSLVEQRFMHTNSATLNLQAINMQLDLIEHILQ